MVLDYYDPKVAQYLSWTVQNPSPPYRCPYVAHPQPVFVTTTGIRVCIAGSFGRFTIGSLTYDIVTGWDVSVHEPSPATKWLLVEAADLRTLSASR